MTSDEMGWLSKLFPMNIPTRSASELFATNFRYTNRYSYIDFAF